MITDEQIAMIMSTAKPIRDAGSVWKALKAAGDYLSVVEDYEAIFSLCDEVTRLRRERDTVIERCATLAESEELRMFHGGRATAQEIAAAIRSLTLPEPTQGA